MPKAMRADLVTTGCDLTGDVGMRGDLRTEEKERGTQAEFVEQIEGAPGIDVGPVVEAECRSSDV